MKKLLLLACIPLFVETAEPPKGFTIPLRTDSLGSQALHLIDLASKGRDYDPNSNPLLPKSPTIVSPVSPSTESVKLKPGVTIPATQQPSIAFTDVKMATLGVVIWANEKRSEERWNAMLEKYRQLENEPFNQKALLHAIIDEIDLSTDKTGNGVWGSLSFTYVKDSQKVDNKKAPEQP